MELIHASHELIDEIDGEEIIKKLERCGRIAYKSEDKITSVSARKFIKNLLDRGHESVIEHVSVTVKFVCDRGVTHELVRHRLAAYTQESTRYCNYSKKGMTFIRPVFWEESPYSPFYPYWESHVKQCEVEYNNLIKSGATPQEARSVLPNSLKTEIVATANLREWRHILKLRTSQAAHPQMREVMIPLLRDFKRLIPIIFDDIELKENKVKWNQQYIP
jgi:thymidylate synthase (FAD)